MSIARCTFSGDRKLIAIDLYKRFGKDNFTVRDCQIHYKTLWSLKQSGILVLTKRGDKDTPHVYQISSLALEKLEQLGDDTN